MKDLKVGDRGKIIAQGEIVNVVLDRILKKVGVTGVERLVYRFVIAPGESMPVKSGGQYSLTDKTVNNRFRKDYTI